MRCLLLKVIPHINNVSNYLALGSYVLGVVLSTLEQNLVQRNHLFPFREEEMVLEK